MNHVIIGGMSRLRPGRLLAVAVAALIAAPISAVVVADDAEAQVWRPRSKQRPRAKGAAIKAKPTGKAEAKSPPKKSRKASRKAKAARTKATAPSKHQAKKRRAPRGDDDFTIIEEDFPDED